MPETRRDTHASTFSKGLTLRLRSIEELEKSKLMPFQAEDVMRLLTHGRQMLCSEMGTGKTAIVVTALRKIYEEIDKLGEENGIELPRSGHPSLVVCPKHLIHNWLDEFEKWWPNEAPHVIRTLRDKDILELRGAIEKGRVILCGYYAMQNVGELTPWLAAVFDEAHCLINRKTKTYHYVNKFVRSQFLWTVTGTPIRRDATDLWGPLHLLYPETFPSYWKFIRENFHTAKNEFGGTDILGHKSLADFRKKLTGYVIRRSKKEVLDQLPDKIRTPYYIEPLREQREIYETMAEEMMLFCGDDGIILAGNSLVKLTRLRQILISPKLLGIDAPSATLDFMKNRAFEVVREVGKVAIFCPFREAIPIIISELRKGLPSDKQNFVVVEPGKVPTPQEIEGGNVLLSTTSMAAGWNAQSYSHAIFVGWDYSPVNNIQSEDRLHRHGQKNAVNVYYILNLGTIEEHIVDILNGKTRWASLTLSAKELLLGKKER